MSKPVNLKKRYTCRPTLSQVFEIREDPVQKRAVKDSISIDIDLEQTSGPNNDKVFSFRL